MFVHLVNVFNLSIRNRSFFRNRVIRNPWVWAALVLCTLIMVAAYALPLMNRVLSLVPLSWEEFRWVILFGLGALLLGQLLKRSLFRKSLIPL